MIAKNLHNVVPLHESMSQWYEKRRTYHGGCFLPTLPTGYMAPMWMTAGKEDVPQMSVRVTLLNQPVSVIMTGDSSPYGNTELTGGGHQLMIHYAATNKMWSVLFDGETLTKTAGGSDADLTEEELRTGWRTLYGQAGGYVISGNLRSPSVTLSVGLYNGDGVQIGSVSQSATFDLLPDRHRTVKRYATFYLGGVDVQNVGEGVCYGQVTIGGHTYVTEPWRWKDDMSGFVRVRYRRSRPILTAANYVTYTDNGETAYAELYLPGIFMKPPFDFEVERGQRDGYSFVKKQVSYVSDQVTILCSGYFAEALRMLWHCDEREYEADGSTTEVDYMESPEPNWVDRHLCEVSVIFRSGTVIQTNGEP